MIEYDRTELLRRIDEVNANVWKGVAAVISSMGIIITVAIFILKS